MFDVVVSETGCMGMCYEEVLLEVIEEENTYLYSHVTKEKIKKIVQEHLIDHKPIEKSTKRMRCLVCRFERRFNENASKLIIFFLLFII